MYHPSEFAGRDGHEFEFLELANMGTNTLNLSGLSFTDGIAFTFTNGTFLSPGDYLVLARNLSAFSLKLSQSNSCCFVIILKSFV